jgi:asparagine synthase (glutamine-hydrolysing)
MCGIIGLWHMDGSPVQRRRVETAIADLRHRGPDGSGMWGSPAGDLVLGHTRLAILDPTPVGAQPLEYADGRLRIVFNGELYNFLEIRADLMSRGYEFRTETDTEVIAAAWIEWGEQALERFNGMWAFALWDQRTEELVLCRDRFGVKPLYYARPDTAIAFASELRALRRFLPSSDVDEDTSRLFLQDPFSIEAGARTFLKGVHRLQAGHLMRIRRHASRTVRWWNTSERLEDHVPDTMREAADGFRARFFDAIRLRLRSDVPVGTCLSGGFDSSAISCGIAQVSALAGERRAPDWRRAFVATFRGTPVDESITAAEVIAATGAEGVYLDVDASSALAEFERVLDDFEEPFTHFPAGPWFIYREVRRHGIVVSLDGHGADELIGGYKAADYFVMRDAPSLWRHPIDSARLAWNSGAALDEVIRPTTTLDRTAHALRALARYHPDLARSRHRLKQYAGRTASVRLAGAAALLRPGRLQDAEGFAPAAASDVLPAHWDEANREFYRLFHVSVLPALLRNFDRLSMAHGVEVRMPFMDWRLVTYAMSLPSRFKLDDGFTKLVAREALAGILPDSIRLSRRKIGFGSPMPQWLNGPLAEWALDMAASQLSRTHQVIDGARLLKLVTARVKAQSWDWSTTPAAWQALHLLHFESRLRSA